MISGLGLSGYPACKQGRPHPSCPLPPLPPRNPPQCFHSSNSMSLPPISFEQHFPNHPFQQKNRDDDRLFQTPLNIARNIESWTAPSLVQSSRRSCHLGLRALHLVGGALSLRGTYTVDFRCQNIHLHLRLSQIPSPLCPSRTVQQYRTAELHITIPVSVLTSAQTRTLSHTEHRPTRVQFQCLCPHRLGSGQAIRPQRLDPTGPRNGQALR